MTLLAVKTNIDVMDGIASLVVLHWVKNFKPYNKHFQLLIRHVGFITKMILVDELLSIMNGIWQNCNLEEYKQLVTEKSE